jgi:hypothetical protein
MPRIQSCDYFAKTDYRAVACASHIERYVKEFNVNSSLKVFLTRLVQLKAFFKALQKSCIETELKVSPFFGSLTSEEHNILAAKWAGEIRRHLISIGLCSDSNTKNKKATSLCSSSTTNCAPLDGEERYTSPNEATEEETVSIRPPWLTQTGEPLFEYGYTLEMFRDRFKKAFTKLRQNHKVSSISLASLKVCYVTIRKRVSFVDLRKRMVLLRR